MPISMSDEYVKGLEQRVKDLEDQNKKLIATVSKLSDSFYALAPLHHNPVIDYPKWGHEYIGEPFTAFTESETKNSSRKKQRV